MHSTPAVQRVASGRRTRQQPDGPPDVPTPVRARDRRRHRAPVRGRVEGVQAAVAVEHIPGVVAVSGFEHHIAGDLPTTPVARGCQVRRGGRWRPVDAEWMQTAIAVEHIPTRAIGKDHHLARDVPTPIGVPLSLQRRRVSVDSEGMQPSIAVEYEPTAAVGQKGEVTRDVPAPVVAAAARRLGRRRRTIGMKSSIAVEYKARLRRCRPRQCLGGASDRPAGPVSAAARGRAVIRADTAKDIKRVQAAPGVRLGRRSSHLAAGGGPRADQARGGVGPGLELIGVSGVALDDLGRRCARRFRGR